MAAEARQNAVERVGEFAMGLVVDGVLQGGSPLRPAEEGKKVRVREGDNASWTVHSPRARKSSPDT
jgi:hypothetical protein